MGWDVEEKRREKKILGFGGFGYFQRGVGGGLSLSSLYLCIYFVFLSPNLPFRFRFVSISILELDSTRFNQGISNDG